MSDQQRAIDEEVRQCQEVRKSRDPKEAKEALRRPLGRSTPTNRARGRRANTLIESELVGTTEGGGGASAAAGGEDRYNRAQTLRSPSARTPSRPTFAEELDSERTASRIPRGKSSSDDIPSERFALMTPRSNTWSTDDSGRRGRDEERLSPRGGSPRAASADAYLDYRNRGGYLDYRDAYLVYEAPQNACKIRDISERMAAKVREAGHVLFEESYMLIDGITELVDEVRRFSEDLPSEDWLAQLQALSKHKTLDRSENGDSSAQRWVRRKRRMSKRSCPTKTTGASAAYAGEEFLSDPHLANEKWPSQAKSGDVAAGHAAQNVESKNHFADQDHRSPDQIKLEEVTAAHTERKEKKKPGNSWDHIQMTNCLDETKVKYEGQPRMLMPDVEATVKKIADDKACSHQHSEYYEKGCAQAVVKSHLFEYTCNFMIFLNAFWIYVDTDYNDAPTLMDSHLVFIYVENAFCVYFVGELAIKVLALKQKRFVFTSMWLAFDLFLVSMMVFETWVVPAFLEIFQSSGVQLDTDFLKSFRLIRLTRAARVVRLLRCVPEFMVLLKALVAGVRAVFFTLVLIVAFAFMFAIILKQLTEETIELQNMLFSTVPMGMKHLLVLAIFPDLADTLEALADHNWAAYIVFTISVLITALAMLNMLIGVLCEVVTMVAEIEKQGRDIEYIGRSMRIFLQEADLNDDEPITKAEFIGFLSRQHVIKFLHNFQIDVRCLLEYIDVSFERNASFEFKDIIKIIGRVRGSNSCTISDINDLRTWLGRELRGVKNILTGEENESSNSKDVFMAIGGAYDSEEDYQDQELVKFKE